MKKLAVLLIAAASLLTGCVVYDTPYRDGGGQRQNRDNGPGRGDHDRDHDRDRDRNHDRDRDGVPNQHDRRPNDPSRY